MEGIGISVGLDFDITDLVDGVATLGIGSLITIGAKKIYQWLNKDELMLHEKYCVTAASITLLSETIHYAVNPSIIAAVLERNWKCGYYKGFLLEGK